MLLFVIAAREEVISLERMKKPVDPCTISSD
jgi:hypothetical protein